MTLIAVNSTRARSSPTAGGRLHLRPGADGQVASRTICVRSAADGLREQFVNNSLPNTRYQQALETGLTDEEPTRNNTCINLLTGGLLVRVQPEEPSASARAQFWRGYGEMPRRSPKGVGGRNWRFRLDDSAFCSGRFPRNPLILLWPKTCPTQRIVRHGQRFVYILRSESHPDCHYVGLTSDVDRRLAWHNHAPSGHTLRHRPWKVIVRIEFADEPTARRFERYLKSGSGREFARRHFAPEKSADLDT